MSHTSNETQRKQYAATLSKAYGYGGAAVVHGIIELTLNMIAHRKKELSQSTGSRLLQRVRKLGSGPKWTEEKYPDIQEHIWQSRENTTVDNRRFAKYRGETIGAIWPESYVCHRQFSEPVHL
jgi:myo-inositol catabolism protein IolC